VLTEGITEVTPADIRFAEDTGYKVKLLGRALRVEDGKIAAYVAPHLIHTSSLLASVDGVFNAIAVRGNAIGDVLFYGQGAGQLATGSAVVADVIDCVKHLKARKYIAWTEGGPEVAADPRELKSRWYVRGPQGADILPERISYYELKPTLEAQETAVAFRVLD